MRDYTVKPKAAPEPEPEEDVAEEVRVIAEYPFSVHGVEFLARMEINADSTLEWSEFAELAMQTDDDIESPAGAAFISKFYKLVLGGAEYRRFRAVLRQNHAGTPLLIEIMQDIQDYLEGAMAEQAERPTVPSSSSSGGRTAKDERKLQIISLVGAVDGGDYVEAEAPAHAEFPPVPGARQVVRQQPKKGKRRSA